MVFLFYFLISLLLIYVVMISLKINIEIINLVFNSQTKKHISNDYNIVLRLKIFKVITIAKITLSNKKVKKINKNLHMQEKIEENIKLKKEIVVIDTINLLNEIIKRIKIIMLKMKIDLDTENAFLTSIIFAMFSSLVPIILSRCNINNKNIKYIVKPMYLNQNFIKFEISGIFELKMIHIIHIIYVLNKKGGNDKNEQSSNRRSYDYSYE